MILRCASDKGRTRLLAALGPVDADELIAFTNRLVELPGIEMLDCQINTGNIVFEHQDMNGAGMAEEMLRLGGRKQ